MTFMLLLAPGGMAAGGIIIATAPNRDQESFMNIRLWMLWSVAGILAIYSYYFISCIFLRRIFKTVSNRGIYNRLSFS